MVVVGYKIYEYMNMFVYILALERHYKRKGLDVRNLQNMRGWKLEVWGETRGLSVWLLKI